MLLRQKMALPKNRGPKKEGDAKKFPCECGYVARGSHALETHKKSHSKCSMCRKSFSSIEESSQHKVTCDSRAKQCALCAAKCFSTEDIEEHFVLDHGITLENEVHDFECQEEFFSWKKEIETSYKTQFVKRTCKTRRNKKVDYLHCLRSGNAKVKSDEARVRQLRIRGPNKINAFCPARMHVTSYDDGRVAVKFVSTHVGHDFVLERLSLDKEYRAELAAKMLQNIPLDDILDAEKKRIEKDSGVDEFARLTKHDVLTRKDLHNIARDFKVSKDHQTKSEPSTHEKSNESISVDACSRETETSKLKELAHKRPSGRSLEDVKAKMMKVMDTANNETQLYALYEHVEVVEALLKSLAKQHST